MKRYLLIMGGMLAFFLSLFFLVEALGIRLLVEPTPWLNRGGRLLERLVTLEERERADDLLKRWGTLAIIVTRPVRKKRGTLVLDREDFLDPGNTDLPIMQATSEMLERRQPQGLTDNSIEVAKATGLPDASKDSCINNRRIRQRNLEELLKHTKKPVERAALETRISQLNLLRRWWELSQGQPIDRRAHQLTLLGYGWSVDINGTVHENKIGADENTNWPLSFWMGGFDGDALCCYISGYLSIPFASKA